MSDIERFEEFFRQFYEKKLMSAASKGERGIEIEFSDLDRFDPMLADKLLSDPVTVLDDARDAIRQIELPEGEVDIEPRFRSLPEQQAIRIRNLRAEHLGKLIEIDGVVRRASEVKPEIEFAIFQCSDCGEKTTVKQTDRTIKPPYACECGAKSRFTLVDKKLFDIRFLTVEEPFEVAASERPGLLNIYLKKDLTTPEMQRKTDPGARLKIVGILKEISKSYKGKTKTQLDFFLDAIHVEPADVEWDEINITEEDEKRIKELANDPDIYKKLVSSIAPSIHGMDTIKEAIAYQLFGGVPQYLPDGTRIRGDIHILIVGDPATGKTQILKLVSKIIPRGRYVSGKGVTGVGLTASVVKDEEFVGGWVLEAGAMVLCHKSTICIDEFDKMNKDDQIAMHEALSTQTISIAKATIVATLPSQTAVLAGSNPKFSRFDPFRPIVDQIDITDTLLSRFDLKFVTRDVPNKEIDQRLAEHVIHTRMKPQEAKPLLHPQLLKKYIAYTKHNCNPKMTEEAANKIKDFYLSMRKMYAGEDKQVVPITLRQYEALMRLAEASARIRMSNTVSMEDAERAIKVMEFSIRQLGYDQETGKIDIDRAEGGVPSSQRSKIHKMLDIIERLEKNFGKEVPRNEIVVAAEDEGLTNREVEDLLGKLVTSGMIFEPKRGKTVQKL